ncbi:MAG TPA: hypothetical protein VEC39_11805 [Vicinamibacterales bacterium]|nr:hypothetical protein [Vicinamibacterales bacterium]
MAIVFSLCAAYVAYCLGTNPAGALTTPDSIHYLEASPIVPLGYPLFLMIFGARGVMIVQPIVFGGALAFLGYALVRHTRSTGLAVAVVAAIIALPQLRGFHASILSESLFLSLLIVLLALSVRFAYQPTWRLLAGMAVAVALAATVRRTGFAFVPVLMVMAFMQRDRLRVSRGVFPAAVAPLLIILGAEQAAAPVVHDGRSSSLLGRHMFAKAALIEAPVAPVSGDPLRDRLHQHLQLNYAPIRSLLAEAPRDLRGVLSLYYETCLQGGCADRSRDLMPALSEPEQTRILGSVALERIRRSPVAFLDLLALNYQSLWAVDRLRHPDRAGALTAFIAAHRRLPFELMALSLKPDHVMEFQPSARVRYMQLLMTAIAFWTAALAAAGIIAALRRVTLPPLFAVATIAALTAHGGLILTATLAAGFSRFMQGLWPAIAVAAMTGAWALLPRRSR